MSGKNSQPSIKGILRIRPWHIFLASGVILVPWVASACASYFILPDWAIRGQLGDTFGSVNALFSGLALAGVVIAIILQREELSLQRRELELTRLELEGQKEQLAKQNITLQKQNFEDTYFQLLRLHSDIIVAMHTEDSGQHIKGRQCFMHWYTIFKILYQRRGREEPKEQELTRINNAYLEFHVRHGTDVGHYFRNMYNIIKFVNNSNVEDKRFYTNIVMAQLSTYELLLLFYSCLSDKGNEKFKPLVEEFALLQGVSKNLLLNTDHVELYGNVAFT